VRRHPLIGSGLMVGLLLALAIALLLALGASFPAID
jgi:hypothetical protein